jgi:hypothetical protein
MAQIGCTPCGVSVRLFMIRPAYCFERNDDNGAAVGRSFPATVEGDAAGRIHTWRP